MKIIKFEPEHLHGFKPHGGHVEMSGISLLDYAQQICGSGIAYSGEVDGKIVGCAGCAKIWEGRYVAWALLSEATGAHMMAITRAVKRGIATIDGRVETIIASGFELGHRWAKMLGFEFHHHEERFLPGGLDADIYVIPQQTALLRRAPTERQILNAEKFIASMPSRIPEPPRVDHFAPGLYARELQIPADVWLTGKKHKHRHLNVVTSGDITVWSAAEGERRIAITDKPFVFVSEPGTKRIGRTHKPTTWITFHVTNETDLAKIEAEVIDGGDALICESVALLEGATA